MLKLHLKNLRKPETPSYEKEVPGHTGHILWYAEEGFICVMPIRFLYMISGRNRKEMSTLRLNKLILLLQGSSSFSHRHPRTGPTGVEAIGMGSGGKQG